jgi:hypothetical protein
MNPTFKSTQADSSRQERRGAPKAPAVDTIRKIEVDEHPGHFNITRSDRSSVYDVFSALATKLGEMGYQTHFIDMEQEWMRDAEGFNRDLQARFEVMKGGRHVAGVEIRNTKGDRDLVMVMFSSSIRTPAAGDIHAAVAHATSQ